MDDDPVIERDDEGFADCDSPDDDVMETNLAAEGEDEVLNGPRATVYYRVPLSPTQHEEQGVHFTREEVEEMKKSEPYQKKISTCHLCKQCWYDNRYSHDCPECGGYALQRPCIICAGQCEQIWHRDVAKELSKITMPVLFNEPLTFLQRITEYLEYSTLLDLASKQDDPADRMMYVAAFAVSSLSSNWSRNGKPFNPLLGETYEIFRPDLGFHLVSEQVCHHPPVSAFHAESKTFKFHGSIQPKLKFWGKSVEINPKGVVTLELLRHGETYTWQNVNCCVHNVIVGKIWIEHSGVMEIYSHTTKYKAVLNLKQGGWFGRDLHKVEGFVYDTNKHKVKALYGSWVMDMFGVDYNKYEEHVKVKPNITPKQTVPENGRQQASDVDDSLPTHHFSTFNLNIPNQVTLWRCSPRPEDSDKYFSFTSFALSLNELKDDMLKTLAPTDSRLRPDVRVLEEGNTEMAGVEKNRLEEKQRATRHDRKKNKEEFVPLWFKLDVNEVTENEDWMFTGKYWDRDWSSCPDIF